jgi:3-oxoacyl-[acyl-carrier-protein] synthase II
MTAVLIAGSGSLSSLGSDKSSIVSAYKQGIPACDVVGEGLGRKWVYRLPPTAEAALKECIAEVPALGSLDRVAQLATCAALMAVSDASRRSEGPIFRHRRVGVVVGSARGATGTTEEAILQYRQEGAVGTVTSPATTLGVVSSTVAQAVGAVDLGIELSMTCTSALHALLVAQALLVAGAIDIAIAGGSEAALTDFTLAQVAALRLAPSFDPGDPSPCRPLADPRDQSSRLVLGEGAAMFVLVRSADRKFLTQPALGEVRGIGCSMDHVPSLTGIDPEGGAFERAMRAAGTSGGGIENLEGLVVLPHAPGTKKGDQAEIQALRRIFGERMPPLYTTKHLTGHTYGASGALSLEYGLLLLAGLRPVLPPYAVCAEYGGFSEEGAVSQVLVNSAGFGGNAVSLLLSKAT